GTEGMKYSLVSREVIADSIETAVTANGLDGVCGPAGCNKNIPGRRMGRGGLNGPGTSATAAPSNPASWKGRSTLTLAPSEPVGQLTAGTLPREDFEGIEKNACPSVGACGGQYTANTMSSSFEALGMSLLASSQLAAPDPAKADSAAESARVLMEAVKHDLK